MDEWTAGESGTDRTGHADPGTTRVSILGPLRARRGTEELDVGGPQQRLVLSLLLTQVGQVVPAEEIIDAIWGGAPPPNAYNVLHRHVGNIRRLFEPGLPPRASGAYLHRRAHGYRISVADDDLDLLRFRHLARAAAVSVDPETALVTYLQALRLWHGPVAAGCDLLSHNPAVIAIEAERVSALCEASDRALGSGRAHEVVSLLGDAAQQHPLDERLHGKYLLCLAGSGRRSEAIQVWRRLNRRLRDEMGVLPGADLCRVWSQLDCSPPPAAPARRLAAVPDRQVEALPSAVAAPCGKTAVAVRLALAHDDGRLQLTLRGVSPYADPEQTRRVLEQFLEAWGVPATGQALEVVPSTGAYRSVVVQLRSILPLPSPALVGCDDEDDHQRRPARIDRGALR